MSVWEEWLICYFLPLGKIPIFLANDVKRTVAHATTSFAMTYYQRRSCFGDAIDEWVYFYQK